MFKSVIFQLILITCISGFLQAQFPGPAGTPGTTAIHKDSSVFVNWAKTCWVSRGYMDIANPSGGVVSFGADTNGTKKAGLNGVVSLGDGGYAVLTFPNPIRNGPGPDFAVFENAFNDTFLELAFVEVSSDGINFFRFPSVSNTQTITQIGPFSNNGDATKIHNLAGKYRVNYGTPFDLQDLANIPGLDVNNVTHVKIIDVVGCIQPPYATYDAQNNIINDPYPTNFSSGGFDLDAVGVIHENIQNINEYNLSDIALLYPQPANDHLYIFLTSEEKLISAQILDVKGKIIIASTSSTINVSSVPDGLYVLKLKSDKRTYSKKIIIQH